MRRSLLLCSVAFDLRNPGLYKSKPQISESPINYIDGKFVPAADGHATMPVLNPVTGKSVGNIPNFGATETNQAIDAAGRALTKWRATLPRDRAVVLRKWADILLDPVVADNVSSIMSRECGKPFAESMGENVYSTRFIEWYANEAERIYGDIIGPHRHGVRPTVIKQPVGVVGVITPWNFPSAMITRSAAAALAAGCTVVVKPSELTPFSALVLAQTAEEAGIPSGVFNVVTGDASVIGRALTDAFAVRKICFTGSTKTGKLLMKQSCDTVKKIALEMGGNAPFIVFQDADVDAAVRGLIFAKFRNAGQTCICANRVFLHNSIYDEFIEKLATKVRSFRVGNALDPKVADFGPVITRSALERIEAVVAQAVGAGARVVVGGKRIESEGNFFEPTVLTNVTHDMDCCQKEIFGPVCPVLTFTDEDEVLQLANSTTAGLAAYFYTLDYKRQFRVSEKLQFGMVGINESALSAPSCPFGGIKESGLGRDGSKYGIEPFMDIKYVLHGEL
jgi:succinate-semialdehyde dehydrogenase/glutarate-semialdehyde dehydrogenase